MTVEHAQEGQYLTVPFAMPPDTESLELRYSYARYDGEQTDAAEGSFRSRREIAIIDLGLIAPDGSQVGASGSNKRSIELSETHATPGYRPWRLVPGEWRILLGAYKVPPEGIRVTYELHFRAKELRLLKGDLHTHTFGSDGVLSAEELAQHALRHGLDYLAITDHNQMLAADALPRIPGLTLIPGVEWTHYKGHALFTGVDEPYAGSFMANTAEEIAARFAAARARGALITISHPFDEGCPFLLDLESLPFDCIEVWNGPMRPANLQSLALWQGLLAAGRRIPACGGSDYHRSQLFLFPGGPTTCVYAMSAGASDILDALRKGHAYIVYAPDGPTLELRAGAALMGDCVRFAEVQEMELALTGLQAGDLVRVVTAQGSSLLLKAESAGDFDGVYRMSSPGFARVEVLREFVPGLPALPALLSNPIYFEA